MSDGEGDDDDRRASKKRKATRACDRCNSQHQPCDNSLPKCSVCERAGTSCTYDRPIRKRGPRVGYTSQNGERLWSAVLKARPEVEDLVLQILKDGTYGDTGVPNADFIKNNDNQTELVNFFNDSRIGRFLQNGDTGDLRIPGRDQKFSIVPTEQLLGSRPHDKVDKPTPSGPHGAPQNPGEIYLQSDDIRRGEYQFPNRVSESSVSSFLPTSNSQSAERVEPPSKSGANDVGLWKDADLFGSLAAHTHAKTAMDSRSTVFPKNDNRYTSTGFTPANFDIASMEISHW